MRRRIWSNVCIFPTGIIPSLLMVQAGYSITEGRTWLFIVAHGILLGLYRAVVEIETERKPND